MGLIDYAHHDGSDLHVSRAGQGLGSVVTLRVRVPSEAGVDHVELRTNPNKEPHFVPAEMIGSVDGWDWWQAQTTIANPVHGYRWLLVAGNGPQRQLRWVNAAGVRRTEPRDVDDFRLSATEYRSEWLPGSIMYQVFPDRFARSVLADDRVLPDWAVPAEWSDPVEPVGAVRSAQFYGGDLDGIIERLDHLVDLGVTLLYLTPFFPAASNHRYDAKTFNTVDPLLGGDEALIRLVEAAHQRGIRVIGDLTSNHCGSSHEWFQAAYGNPDAPESDFFVWYDDAHTDYERWLGVDSLPKFNWHSAELRRRFFEANDSVVKKMLQTPFNLDGWRIDVANMTGRLGDTDLNREVRVAIRHAVDEVAAQTGTDKIVLAEFTNDGADDFNGDAWQGAMTYTTFTRPLWSWLSSAEVTPWLDAQGQQHTEAWFFGQPTGGIPNQTARDFVEAFREFSAAYPWPVLLGNMMALDTHDTGRFATNASPEAVEIGLGLSVTLPGVPVVFAGDELGLTGADGESSRTPMPWDTVRNPDVAERLELYRQLLKLRQDIPALTDGGLRWLAANDHALAFVRESSNGTALVFAASQATTLHVPVSVLGGDPASAAYGSARYKTQSAGDSGETQAAIVASSPGLTVWSLPGVHAP